MSDSDSDDSLARDVYNFQNESTMVSGTGPSGNFSTTGLSFRSNFLSSTTKQMAPIMEGQRLAEASYNQQRHRYIDSRYGQHSLNNRREVSPFSTRSMCQSRQRNDYYTLDPQIMSSARSVYSGRAVSPMSMRSVDTTASRPSVDELTNFFKHGNYSKREWTLIRQACNRYRKLRVRTKIRKRSYHRSRRRISDDEGCDSSTSSDDRSSRTINNNMSSCRSMVTDISNFRRTIQNSNILKDCSNTFKCNSVRSEIGGPVNLNNTQSSIMSSKTMLAWRNMPKLGSFQNSSSTLAPPIVLQKERFASGFPLPSQRFNKFALAKTITEHPKNVSQNNDRPQNVISSISKNSARNTHTDNDDDNIFPKSTTQKRNIDCVDHNNIYLPTQKRQKTLSPCKNNNEAGKLMAKNKDEADDFVFAKPSFLIKRTVKEKWIAESADPSSDNFSRALINPPVNIQSRPEEENKGKNVNEEINSTQNCTNVSMRPSFIKRKLFSQKANFSEQINTSTDSLNSPQNPNSVTKEKHKTRKLQQVLTQSCLNRDIQQDNNLLDLIHKIVPIDQMNITNQTNITDRHSNNKSEDNDKWDVTSTNKNDDDLSETFTDEEILNSTVRILQKETNPNINKRKEDLQEKVPDQITAKNKENVVKQNATATKQKSCKVVVHKMNFWDTDFESDVEYQPTLRTDNLDVKENQNSKLDVQPKEASRNTIFSNAFSFTKASAAPSTSFNFAKESAASSPTLNALPAPSTSLLEKSNKQKFNPLTLRIMSHRVPRRNNPDRSLDLIISAVSKTETPKQNTFHSQEPPKQIAKVDNKESRETVTKNNKKSQKGKKQASKTDKHIETVQNLTTKILSTNVTKNQSNKKVSINKKTPKRSQKENETKKELQAKHQSGTKIKQVEHNQLKLIKQVEPKTQKTKNIKNKNTDKTTLENSTLTGENNNNTSRTRPVRSSRLSKNVSADRSDLALNQTLNMTLRSGKTLSGKSEENTPFAKNNNFKKNAKIKMNFISSSLPVEKKSVAKKTFKKNNNFLSSNPYESDVSFSLCKESPSPIKTRTSARVLRNNDININCSTSDLKTNQSRIKYPNARYLS